jgi:hypothetical protein
VSQSKQIARAQWRKEYSQKQLTKEKQKRTENIIGGFELFDKKTLIYAVCITFAAAIVFPLNYFFGLIVTFFVSYSLLIEKQKYIEKEGAQQSLGGERRMVSNETQQKIFDAIINGIKATINLAMTLLKFLLEGWNEFNRK